MIKKDYVTIPSCGKTNNLRKVYTDGSTKDFPKSKVKKIVNDVFEDCINNPRKYLEGKDE